MSPNRLIANVWELLHEGEDLNHDEEEALEHVGEDGIDGIGIG